MAVFCKKANTTKHIMEATMMPAAVQKKNAFMAVYLILAKVKSSWMMFSMCWSFCSAARARFFQLSCEAGRELSSWTAAAMDLSSASSPSK